MGLEIEPPSDLVDVSRLPGAGIERRWSASWVFRAGASVMNHELNVPRTLMCTCVHCWLCYETRWSISVVENLRTGGRTGGSGIDGSHFASTGAA
jgi:hypothetical protein